MLVNIDQVRKYDVPGPRYTSYPPAVHFRKGLSRNAVLNAIQESPASRDISLYFHLPFCRTLCWYCGCNTVITKNQSQSATYLEYLKKEICAVAPLIDSGRRVVQIHLGGGTPTFLLPDELRALGDAIRSNFHIADEVEAGVEIDPRRMTLDHVMALREAGMNRASIGVQDFHPKVQQAVNRIQTFEQTQQVIEWLRTAGFRSISIDLIYGLPYQTVDSFAATLQKVLSLAPDRLAVFSYAHVPWIKPSQKILERTPLPDAAMKLSILKLTVEKLTASGYEYIGMDHFARVDDELVQAQKQGALQRNFQGYSTCGGADIYGFGVSAISQSGDMYWQNEKDLETYYRVLDAGMLPVSNGYVLSDDDKMRRQVIMRLMCDMRLDFAAMSEELGVDFAEHFHSEIESLSDLEADGLVLKTAKSIEVTEAGRLLIRNAAMRFDAHLNQGSCSPVYSRTI
jgi:oxygen-independent coproporphyrinogen III oxidase